MGWIEISATLLGLAYVVLLMRENIWCWPVGNVSVALMAVSCFQAHLYADMSLQVFYFIIGFYGWIIWLKGGKDSAHSLEIQKVNTAVSVSLVIGFAATFTITYLVLLTVRGAALTLADSLLFAASMVATYMQAKKYIENWLLWVPINLSYMAVYYLRGLDAYIVLSFFFAILSTAGWFRWSKVLKETPNFRSL